jgi:hypothetical protein
VLGKRRARFVGEAQHHLSACKEGKAGENAQIKVSELTELMEKLSRMTKKVWGQIDSPKIRLN